MFADEHVPGDMLAFNLAAPATGTATLADAELRLMEDSTNPPRSRCRFNVTPRQATAAFLLLCLAAICLGFGYRRPSAPPQTTECGDFPAPLSATQPNVLLIGDSISMSAPYPPPGGYGTYVREGLAAQNIDSWHNGGLESGGQAASTLKGLRCTDPEVRGNWLSFVGTYDVIHFNFGLHDVASGDVEELVELEQYAANVAVIYHRLAARARKVIFATTTPCPNLSIFYNCSASRVVAYNSAALAALVAAVPAGLCVDDLYAEVVGYCGEVYLECDLQKRGDIHFAEKGQQFLGSKVINSIVSALS